MHESELCYLCNMHEICNIYLRIYRIYIKITFFLLKGEDSACSTTDTISICKSSLLFSPLKETPILPPGGSYSVDSLDCEDMLLTCQTNNKDNYTIAFEGSITMYSDGSQDFENQGTRTNDIRCV